ncbi:MAG TPA: helix-turn-helix domain-containing protein [Pseudonocardiaceae bacterium]|jgi:DNA-binding transcriptional MerR regulator|nr:helix-turn-helix domain-containing protein [Pseudonocardiaceae bacterium]
MALVSIGEFARLSRLSPRALRLYAELGLLLPARTDPDSGYRWYAEDQLEPARLVASLRQLGVPLARIKVVLDLAGPAVADQVIDFWTGVELDHAVRRDLAALLVNRLNGTRSVMHSATYDVTTRTIPARSLLSLQRHVSAEDLLTFGRSFLKRFWDSPVPRIDGTPGAPFVIYYGEVSADSDGPIEWCRPVPEENAAELAARFPDLVLRVEPAHEEAFVHLDRAAGVDGAQAEAVLQAIVAWAGGQRRQPNGPARQIFISRNSTDQEGPACDFAVPMR